MRSPWSRETAELYSAVRDPLEAEMCAVLASLVFLDKDCPFQKKSPQLLSHQLPHDFLKNRYPLLPVYREYLLGPEGTRQKLFHRL